jgi:hypothetical protein
VAEEVKMSDQNGQKSDDAKSADQGFLSRWSARKTQIARATTVPEDNLEEQKEAAGGRAEQESDEEASLSDNELLEKYELPDPNDVEEEAALDRFFDGKTPERLRQMALRRLWRINPLFGVVDDMVEYGEDYTDAATVIDGMQTAYQVGKGYLNKVIESGEEDESIEHSNSQVDEDTQADQELNVDNEAQKSEFENQIDPGVENREGFVGESEHEFPSSSSADDASFQRSSSVKASLVDKNRGEVSHVESLVTLDENKSVSEPAGKNATPMKPKRMQFRVNS